MSRETATSPWPGCRPGGTLDPRLRSVRPWAWAPRRHRAQPIIMKWPNTLHACCRLQSPAGRSMDSSLPPDPRFHRTISARCAGSSRLRGTQHRISGDCKALRDPSEDSALPTAGEGRAHDPVVDRAPRAPIRQSSPFAAVHMEVDRCARLAVAATRPALPKRLPPSCRDRIRANPHAVRESRRVRLFRCVLKVNSASDLLHLCASIALSHFVRTDSCATRLLAAPDFSSPNSVSAP